MFHLGMGQSLKWFVSASASRFSNESITSALGTEEDEDEEEEEEEEEEDEDEEDIVFE